MNDKIKNALGAELAAQVEAKLVEAKIEVGVTNDGTWVKAEKHDSLKAEHDETVKQMGSLQDKVKALESDSTATDLKSKLEAISTEYEQFKTDTSKREAKRDKTVALTKALEGAGAVKSSIDLLINVFDLEKLQLDNKGNIVDLDDVLSPVKTERKELFAQTTISGDPPPKGKGSPNGDLDDQTFFNQMMKRS